MGLLVYIIADLANLSELTTVSVRFRNWIINRQFFVVACWIMRVDYRPIWVADAGARSAILQVIGLPKEYGIPEG